MNRPLIIAGALLLLAGICWPWLRKVPLLHLPGDLLIERPSFKLFIPITTMLLVSALLSAIAWILRR